MRCGKAYHTELIQVFLCALQDQPKKRLTALASILTIHFVQRNIKCLRHIPNPRFNNVFSEMAMQNAFEQFAKLNKRGMDAALSAWQIAYSSIEEVSRLNIEATKALLAEASEQAQSLGQIKSINDVSTLGSTFANTSFNRALGYSRHCQKIAMDSQAEVAKWVKSNGEEFKQGFGGIMESVTAAAPQPSKDAAYAAMQSATALTDSLIEATQKAVKQSSDFADAAITATAEVVNNARSKKS